MVRTSRRPEFASNALTGRMAANPATTSREHSALPRDTTVRQRITALLSSNGPVTDASGRATSVLKEKVDYEQSDAGFSQLVAAMERDGQIVREIRGKRTFKISAAPGMESTAPPQSPMPDEIDYDELAAALLVRTAQVLASSQEPAESVGWARRRIQQLEGRIGDLERELARTKAEAKVAADERDELQSRLEAASHNLNLLAEQRQAKGSGRASQRLGSEEQALLYELRRRSGS